MCAMQFLGTRLLSNHSHTALTFLQYLGTFRYQFYQTLNICGRICQTKTQIISSDVSSLDIVVFTVNEHENICIAGLNAQAGFCTEVTKEGMSTIFYGNFNKKALMFSEGAASV